MATKIIYQGNNRIKAKEKIIKKRERLKKQSGHNSLNNKQK